MVGRKVVEDKSRRHRPRFCLAGPLGSNRLLQGRHPGHSSAIVADSIAAKGVAACERRGDRGCADELAVGVMTGQVGGCFASRRHGSRGMSRGKVRLVCRAQQWPCGGQ